MGMLIAAGKFANLLVYPSSNGLLVATPAAAAGYPVSRLPGPKCGLPFAWSSPLGSNPRVHGDLNVIGNPSFTVDLAGWTDCGTGGASTRTTTGGQYNTAPGALKLDSGAGPLAARYYEVEVPSGMWWRLRSMTRGDGGSGRAVWRVWCKETKKFWNGSAWVGTASDLVLGSTSATYAATDGNVQVEGYGITKRDTVTIRAEVRCPGGVAYVDDVTFSPGINVMAFFAHTFEPGYTITPEYSDDGVSYAAISSAATVAGGAIAHPGFRFTITPFSGPMFFPRFVRFTVTYAAVATTGIDSFTPTSPLIGKWFVGQTQVLSKVMPHPSLVALAGQELMPQIRTSTPGGHVEVKNRNLRSHRRRTLPFRTRSTDAFEEVRSDIWERSRAGEHPTLLALDGNDAATFFGLVKDAIDHGRVGGTVAAPIYEFSLEIEDLPGFALGV